ncbi:MAG TPA: Tim44 domain-containing protein [Methylomirabilota bacterium]|jgi:predicted lipid-binding transport protein (Tim44 family)
MKRTLALAVLMALAILPVLSLTEVWARAGGGGSSGSRGSRSYSSPARPPASPVSPSQPSSPAATPMQPQRPGWGGMMGGMLGGLLLGGLLGGLLFGGGFGSGIGLMEILIIGALGWFALSYMRRRQAAGPSGYAMAGGGFGAGPASRDDAASSARYGTGAPASTATLEPPAGPSDLERGIGHIRQMDPGFDLRGFSETASDIFFKVQGAWTARDLRSVSASLTPEMAAQLQRDCDRLRVEGKINRLENIAVRSAAVTEAWQETGQDYVTVHFLASLLDYTTDESGARVLDGSRTEPVKFEEYWTFVRPVGPGPFRLSAIQQN